MKGISAMAAGATLFLGLGLMSYAAYAANPGDACSPEGVMGVNQDVAMTCTGGVWVLNALRLGDKSVTCDSGKAGYMRYSGGQFEGCNGSSWVQLVSSKLKVYHSNGTTVLGNYLGSFGTPEFGYSMCTFTIYADETTGITKWLDRIDCSEQAPNVTVFFSGADCSGTPFSQYASSYTMYCCTGSGTCTTNKCVGIAGTSSDRTVISYRSSEGICHQPYNSTMALYDVRPSLCGDSPCLVK